MNIELEQKLFAKYPELLKNLVYIESDDGWFNLLDKAFQELNQFDGLRLVQVKSKFAALRIYYLPIAMEANNTYTYEDVDNIVGKYEQMSKTACEACGRPGKGVSCGGWLMTLCTDDFEIWQQRHAGE
jgi:hypothetical protein